MCFYVKYEIKVKYENNDRNNKGQKDEIFIMKFFYDETKIFLRKDFPTSRYFEVPQAIFSAILDII